MLKSRQLLHLLVFVICTTMFQHAFATGSKVISGTLVVQFPSDSSELPKSFAAGNYVQNSCLVDLKATSIWRVDILTLGDNDSINNDSSGQLKLAVERANSLRDRLLKLGVEDRFIWTTARTTNSTPLGDGENAFIFYTGENCFACSRSGECDISDRPSSKSSAGTSTTTTSPLNVEIKLKFQFPVGSAVVPESVVIKNATYTPCLKSIYSVKATATSANDSILERWGVTEQTELATKRANSIRALIADLRLPDMAIGAAIFVRPGPISPAGYVPKPEQENAWIEYSGTCKDESDCFKCKVLSE